PMIPPVDRPILPKVSAAWSSGWDVEARIANASTGLTREKRNRAKITKMDRVARSWDESTAMSGLQFGGLKRRACVP
ncbi:2399_t:CDS:1, partial [Acaulospora colombiana]